MSGTCELAMLEKLTEDSSSLETTHIESIVFIKLIDPNYSLNLFFEQASSAVVQ